MTDDGLDDLPPRRAAGIADPAAWAIASLVLGTLSLAGLGLLNGSVYVLPLAGGQPEATRTLLAGLLGAAIAAAGVVLAVLAQRRTHPGDPEWVARVAGAGVLVGGTAVVLRLAAMAAAAVQVTGSGFFAPL